MADGQRPSQNKNVLMEGFMKKQGGSVKTWKRRYFLLKERVLATPYRLEYYKGDESVTYKGVINLEECTEVRKGPENGQHKNLIQLVSPRRVYQLICDDSDYDKWYDALQTILEATSIKGAIPFTSAIAHEQANAASRNKSTGTEPILCEGYLKKIKKRGKKSKRRWFVLQGVHLRYYKKQGAPTHKGEVTLQRCLGLKDENEDGRFRFTVVTRDRTLQLEASSEPERARWIAALQAVLQSIAQRKAEKHQTLTERALGSGAATSAEVTTDEDGDDDDDKFEDARSHLSSSDSDTDSGSDD
eukprot:Colp12_sorted_trinity150504_noHs@8294